MEDNKESNESELDHEKFVEVDPTKINITKNPSILITNFIAFLRGILSIKTGKILYNQVLESTKEGVVFKGYNVWILICSILIASVGLNMDSTAVIVGAMLISPLMGPIKGVGFGIGTNDLGLIRLSLKNIGITVIVSLFTSTLYFLITPIDQLTNQIFLRTEPNFLDVIVAFSGGLAGAIAAVKGKVDTVISGVAIATALMPPLCTAGYGLANAEWGYFLGASYLFLINSVLITLATLLIVRSMNFPKHEYVNVKLEKKVKNYIIIFMVVILAPSTYLFYTMIKRTVFKNNAQAFIEEVVVPSVADKAKVTSYFGYSKDSSYIDIDISGSFVGDDMIDYWKREKSNKKYDLGTVFLKIYQVKDYSSLESKFDLIQQNNLDSKEFFTSIREKDKKINDLNEKYDLLERESTQKDFLNFNYLINSFKIDYPEFSSVNINRSFGVDRKGNNDTTYVLFVRFNNNCEEEKKEGLKSKLSNRLKFELNQKSVNKQDSIPVIVF
jgi:uncharacterized hydrophobic protein (TIGR00271 family)